MRRTNGERPPVLLLGAGASVDAGIGAMGELYAFFGVKDFDAFSTVIAPTSPAERYRYLADFLHKREPMQVTPGYHALATLCAQKYFDLVLTTNMDPLLDDALTAARPPLWRKDYLLLVNGVIRPDRLTLLLHSPTPRVKIVKLHGEIFQPFMAWTVAEMDTFLTEIEPALTPALVGRDVLVVGHSLRDTRIRGLAQATGGDLWFTHPTKVPDHLLGNATMRAVVAPEAAFEKFFPALAHELLLDALLPAAPASPASTTRSRPTAQKTVAIPLPAGRRSFSGPQLSARPQAASSVDELMAAVLAVVGDGGILSSTAFLLDDPRVIVCDAFASKSWVDLHGELWLLAADGRRFKTHVIRTNGAHAFGPSLLAVPDALQVPGLRLNAEAMAPGEIVQVVVAAGDKTGISTGAATTGIEVTSRIEPIGVVGDLAMIDAVVRPGSSGAPVVDYAMAIRGFIVAGSSDTARPVTLMYPSQYWADYVTGRPTMPKSPDARAKVNSSRSKASKRLGHTRKRG